jgi:RHS repeat-associated protein
MDKTVNGITTPFVWDFSGTVPLLLQAGSTDYVYGPGALPLEQITGSSVEWLHHDQIGSTRLITSSTGATLATFSFGPYGNTVKATGSAKTSMLYAGQYRDSESGLYYLRARYYDPATGQFLTVDPDIATTRSPYAYVSGDPLNTMDPTGEWPSWVTNTVSAVSNAASTAWNDTGGRIVNAVQNGGLPNGHCIVLIQNNCQENFFENSQALDNTPVIGFLIQSDPVYNTFRDVIDAASGHSVCPDEWLSDALGVASLGIPGPGSILEHAGFEGGDSIFAGNVAKVFNYKVGAIVNNNPWIESSADLLGGSGIGTVFGPSTSSCGC